MPESTEPTFTLNRIVMHKIDKTGRIGTLHPRSSVLETAQLDIKNFAKTISFSYHKRTSKEFARFKHSPTPIYQNLIDTYTAHGESDDKFLEFSIDAANHLKDEMNVKPTSTGGYLIFADYSIRDRFIMAVLLNNKSGFTVDDDSLAIQMIQELNTEQIAMAGFINMTTYQGMSTDRRYLSFMRGVKDISDYFVKFIGADDDKETSKDMTKTFVTALKDHLNSLELTSDQITLKENLVYNYCEEKRKDKEPVTLIAISALINPEDPHAFFQYTQVNDYELNTTIESIDKSQLDKLKLFKYSGNGMTLNFKRSLYETGTIRLTDNNTKLEIIMPEQMKSAILEELKRNE